MTTTGFSPEIYAPANAGASIQAEIVHHPGLKQTHPRKALILRRSDFYTRSKSVSGDGLSTIAAPEIRENNQSWTPVLLLALAFMLNYADRQYFFAVFAQVRVDLALSDTLLGLTGSVFAWSYAVAMPLAGYMADRIPRHRLVIAALILWSLATLGTSVSRDLSQLIFWRGMMGLTEALFVPSAFALIATIYPIAARSRAISALGLA
jgi:sugar phosphate permease